MEPGGDSKLSTQEMCVRIEMHEHTVCTYSCLWEEEGTGERENSHMEL